MKRRSSSRGSYFLDFNVSLYYKLVQNLDF